MSIDRGLNQKSRSQVAWVGGAPPQECISAYDERQFSVVSVPSRELASEKTLSGLAQVIFSQDANNRQEVLNDIRTYSKQAIDFGCRIIVSACEGASDSGLKEICDVTRGVGLDTFGAIETAREPLAQVRIATWGTGWTHLANHLLVSPIDPAPRLDLDPKFDVTRITLRQSQRLLLQRAFSDCTELRLKQIVEGRSRSLVFCAFAQLAKGTFGQWPLPYFIKIGPKECIYREYLNYADKVDPYVPFHLSPRVDKNRCVLGANLGVIVGNFVDGSESMIKCALECRATSAIAGLFGRTLSGWYSTAKPDTTNSLGTYLEGRIRYPIPPARFRKAKGLGATKSCDELAILLRKCDTPPLLIGPHHGDLHAKNIRVRGGDAIVIDFLREGRGPVILDAAWLEASLLVDGFSESVASIPGTRMQEAVKEIHASLKHLYSNVSLLMPPEFPNIGSSTYWFEIIVRQIRQIARNFQTGPNQYAAALAYALKVKSEKDQGVPEPESSFRALAYVLAEAILVNTPSRVP